MYFLQTNLYFWLPAKVETPPRTCHFIFAITPSLPFEFWPFTQGRLTKLSGFPTHVKELTLIPCSWDWWWYWEGKQISATRQQLLRWVWSVISVWIKKNFFILGSLIIKKTCPSFLKARFYQSTYRPSLEGVPFWHTLGFLTSGSSYSSQPSQH